MTDGRNALVHHARIQRLGRSVAHATPVRDAMLFACIRSVSYEYEWLRCVLRAKSSTRALLQGDQLAGRGAEEVADVVNEVGLIVVAEVGGDMGPVGGTGEG